jgi:predicted ATPase
MILDDLHWATAETIAVLREAAACVKDCPLLVVASFRDDESPGLPQRIPAATLLKLPRLDVEAIRDLSASMLGPAGTQPQVLELLARESEGNAFFMIEVVRTLADDAGSLDAVGRRTLPREMFAKGIQAVVKRRLERVPEEALALLKLAAVAGRKLDTQVLSKIEPRLEPWLHACKDAAILDVSDVVWQFAHDKLREQILRMLVPKERQDLHRQIGQAIERVYGQAGTHSGALGYHFDEAGDLTKAGRYLAQAGAEAIVRGGLQQAILLLERAAELQRRAAVPAMAQAITLRRLSRALLAVGRGDDCLARAREALALLGQPIPSPGPRRWWALLSEATLEARYRFAGPIPESDPQCQAVHQELLRILYVTVGFPSKQALRAPLEPGPPSRHKMRG